MIAGKPYFGLKSDIWSTGVILYAMLAGYLPYEDPDTAKLYKKILTRTYKAPKWISEEGKDLISYIFTV